MVSIPEDMPPVTVDAVQVQRILVNLLENAVKFSPEGTQVDGARDEDPQGG